MEPQTETTNSSEPNQASPLKESLGSMLASPRYWLAALLTFLGLFLSIYMYFVKGLFSLPVLFLPLMISFAINLVLPFAINNRRAFYLSLPSLLLSITFFVYAFIHDSRTDLHGDMMNSLALFTLCIFGPYFMLLLFLCIWMGRLGAKASESRYRLWIIGATLLAFLVVGYFVIRAMRPVDTTYAPPLTTATLSPPLVVPTLKTHPTNTLIPSTNTLTPINISETTAAQTPMPSPNVPMAEQRYIVEGGGFSFQVPEGYSVTTKLYSAFIDSPDYMITFNLWGAPNEKQKGLVDLKQDTVEPEGYMSGLVESTEIMTTTIGGNEALMIDLTLSMMGTITTTVALATPNDGAQTFSGEIVGNSAARGDEQIRQTAQTGEPAVLTSDIFNAILATIEFQEIPQSANLPTIDLAHCPVSPDETYGLTQENPIVIPYVDVDESRVFDYLELITGPEGQSILYEWANAVSPATNLFSVTYEGLAVPVIFYIQEIEPMTTADLQLPLVPSGFACKKP